MSDRFVVVPASYVYLLRGDGADREVLLGLRQNTGYRDGYWAAAVAGHVERGEDAAAAAVREAAEELRIAPRDLTFLTTMQRTQFSEPIDERVDFFFTATAWTGEPAIGEPHKCAELRWWPLRALPGNLVPHEARVLAGLHAGTVTAYTTFGFTADERD